MMKVIATFLQKSENKKPKPKSEDSQPTNELKPKWPLNWIPPNDLRHPAWRYD